MWPATLLGFSQAGGSAHGLVGSLCLDRFLFCDLGAIPPWYFVCFLSPDHHISGFGPLSFGLRVEILTILELSAVLVRDPFNCSFDSCNTWNHTG